VAFADLSRRLRGRADLIDLQVPRAWTTVLGTHPISRERYLDALLTVDMPLRMRSGVRSVRALRLTQECIAVAGAAGTAVLRGRATQAGVTVPFRPLTEALFSIVRSGSLPDDPELVPYRTALGRLIPEWRAGTPYESDDSPVVLAESVLRLLSAVGRGRGALLCLSDLHDCDAETMSVVGSCCAAPSTPARSPAPATTGGWSRASSATSRPPWPPA
jgi:hypothetical protein